MEVRFIKLATFVTAKSVTTEATLVASKFKVLLRMLSALKAKSVTPTAPANTEVTLTLMFSKPTTTGVAVMSSVVLRANTSRSKVDVSTITSSVP